jgi:hypothetical protein
MNRDALVGVAVLCVVLASTTAAATVAGSQQTASVPDDPASDHWRAAVGPPAPAVGADGRPTSAPPRQTSDPAPDIEVRPSTLTFSNESNDSETKTLDVRNVGDAPLTVRLVAVVGPDRDAFEQSTEGPFTLAPGDRREITVTFEAAGSRSRFATLHVMSDDPDEPQRNVWLTNTRTVADVSPSRVLERKTLVNATVTNVEANTTQSINVSWPLTRDDAVAVDALSFTPERSGNVTFSVATNASRFGAVPEFALEDGTEPAGFVHVDHSIANENVRDVTVRFRVRADQLVGNETGPEDVAFYRYEAGRWTELPTRYVAERGSHYFFEARAPGLSDFATGVKQAKFRITDAVVTVARIRTDEGTTVRVRVRNVGGADGTYRVKLLLEDAVVDRRELSIAPNGTRQATFERSFDRVGVYEVYVNDRFVANVTVESATTPATGTTSAVGGDGTESDRPVPGFDAGVAVAALLVATLLLRLGRR